VPEDVAVSILDVLSLHGPYEVRMMLRPNGTTPLIVRCLVQGEFEVPASWELRAMTPEEAAE